MKTKNVKTPDFGRMTDKQLAAYKAARKPTRRAAAKAAAVNVAATVRDLVVIGLDNAAIFAELLSAGVLKESQRNYPGWYRAQFARLSR